MQTFPDASSDLCNAPFEKNTLSSRFDVNMGQSLLDFDLNNSLWLNPIAS